jgi:mycothiol synthase
MESSKVTDMVRPTPPDGYTARAATWDDLEAVIQLFQQVDVENWGEVDITEQEVRHEWEDQNFDLAADSWLVLAKEGGTTPAGYASLVPRDGHRQLQAWGDVLPSHRGRGIGSFLVDAMEARAVQHLTLVPSDQNVVIRAGVNAPDAGGRRLIEGRGYRLVRHFWRMDRTLGTGVESSGEIPGIRLRPFAHGTDDRAFHAAMQESFADHWGFAQRGFDEWSAHRFHESGFDPGLWFVAEEDGEIVGALLGIADEGIGWVENLGVRASWRRRGIGQALLRLSFLEFQRRGLTQARLTVDAANETGATAMYERAGMRATRQYDVLEKRLR